MDLHSALEAFYALVASAIGTGVLKLVLLLCEHYKFKITEQEQAEIKHFATQGALIAEEWAAKRWDADHIVSSGADKLAVAAGHMATNIPGITPEQAEAAIHSVLPALGLGATAAPLASAPAGK